MRQSSCCIEDTLGDTLIHARTHDKYSKQPSRERLEKLRPSGCLENLGQKVKPFSVYHGLLQDVLFTVRGYNVLYANVSSSATWLRIWIAKLSRNTVINLVCSYKVNQNTIWMQCIIFLILPMWTHLSLCSWASISEQIANYVLFQLRLLKI